MDIQTSFNNQILQTMKTLVEHNLNLTVGQQLPVKVIAMSDLGITLKWGGQNLTIENQNPRATFLPYLGQNVTLQVAQISPELVFKIVALDSQFYATPPSTEKMNAMRLTLATAPLVNRIDESMKNFATHAQGQSPIEAKIVGLVGNKIQLELIVDTHQGDTNAKKMLVTIEPQQLQLLPAQKNESFKIGQSLTLAITKIGAVPEFKQLPSRLLPQITTQEQKIADLMKQLLPKHESPNSLLNQLKSDLPQLESKNSMLSATLKQNAAALFKHLPPNEQLFNPQKLRHLIYYSGLFFDAKTNIPTQPKSPVSAQTTQYTVSSSNDLKMPLLNLLQHTNSNDELKQLASTLLQNILKKEGLSSPELTKIVLQEATTLQLKLLPLLQSETVPQSLKNIASDILSNLKSIIPPNITQPPVEKPPVYESIGTDFKNDLFKLMDTLKQGIAQQSKFLLTDTEVAQLQNLHNKTENALANVVLDQLHSVPKEDSGKQVWRFELPFMLNNQVESLKMEIQHDKANSSNDIQQARHWSINLTLTPPKLGEMECVISYRHGVVNTYFKNQLPQTTMLISQHLENLKQQFQKAGLITGLMSSHDNFPPVKSAYLTGGTSLLSETV